jgi:hypothetical protein
MPKGTPVIIRPYRPGDESAQAAIWNAATAGLPKFKPTTVPEILRRVRARDFEPATLVYAEEAGKVVGYAQLQANGRVSHPWCLPGHEACAEPLFEHVLTEMRGRKIANLFAAYRGDWKQVHDFFARHGFAKARDVINYYVDVFDLPTASAQARGLSPLTPDEVPQVLALMPGVFGDMRAEELERHLFKNPYFQPSAVNAMRSRNDNQLLAVSILVLDPTFADANAIDSDTPCYRTGAFGTERMKTKRVNGLFSYLARPDRNLHGVGIELLGHAAHRLSDDDTVTGFAAQVASDQAGLAEFYRKYFRRQGSFPVLERKL